MAEITTVIVDRDPCNGDHNWTGPERMHSDGNGSSVTCAKCGMDAMHYSLMYADDLDLGYQPEQDWFLIAFDSDGKALFPMPPCDELVEVLMDDGTVRKSIAFYDGPEDWDFLDTDDIDVAPNADSLLPDMAAWRPIPSDKREPKK